MESKNYQKVQVWVYWYPPGCPKGDPYFLLLLTRPERGSFWQPVTGSVEKRESLVQAAIREAVEETGLSFKSSPKELAGAFEFESPRGRVVEYPFALEANATPSSFSPAPSGFPLVRLDPQEHVQFQWIKGSQALKIVAYPSNVRVLELMLKQLNIG